MVEKLSPDAVKSALAELVNWSHDETNDAIVRHFRFENFSQAFGFMSRVALAAEKAGHHPDWSNSYADVEIRLLTHDAGGLSHKDIDLAHQIDVLLG